MKKTILYMCVLVTMLCSTCQVSYADNSIGDLSAGLYDKPVYESLTTTRYSPWFLQYHITSNKEVEAGRRGGDGGQIIFAFESAPTNPNHMLLGTDTSGVWISSDGGANWNLTGKGLNLVGVNDIEFSPYDENIVYLAASSMATGSSERKSEFIGIYKSEDGGNSWKQIHEAYYLRSYCGDLIQFDKNKKGIVYVATHKEGVLKTVDDGATWTNLGLADNFIRQIYYNDESGCLAAVSEQSGVMVSTDDGATWNAKNNGIASKFATSIAVNPNDRNHWFVVADGVLYQSFNAGEEWAEIPDVLKDITTNTAKLVKVTFGCKNPNGNPMIYIGLEYTRYCLRTSSDLGKSWVKPIIHNEIAFDTANWGYVAEPICVHPTDPMTISVPYNSTIYKTTDGGKNFYLANSGFSGYRATGFLFDEEKNNDMYFIFTDKGIAKSIIDDANNAYPPFDFLTNDEEHPLRFVSHKTVHAIARDPKNRNHIICCIGNWGNDTILAESWDGINFKHIPGTENKFTPSIKFHSEDSNIIYAGYIMSRDGGKTWESLPNKIVEVSPFNSDIVYSIDEKRKTIYKSGNRGLSWSVLASDLPVFERVRADLYKPDKLWVGTRVKGIICINGRNIVKINEDNGFKNYLCESIPIYDIAQDPHNEKHLVAGGFQNLIFGPSPGLYETYDGGESWNIVTGMPGMRDIWTIQFHPNLPSVFVGTSSGTFVYEYEKYYKWINSDKEKNKAGNNSIEPLGYNTVFKDIDKHWAKKVIEEMAAVGVVPRDESEFFKPDINITRAEFVEYLVRLLHIDTPEDIPQSFADVDKQALYFKYIEAAKNKEIISGDNNNLFMPNSEITRQEAAVIIYKTLTLMIDVPELSNEHENKILSSFSDQGKISDWSRKAIAGCVVLKIINSTAEGTIRAQDCVSKAEAVVMLNNLLRTVY